MHTTPLCPQFDADTLARRIVDALSCGDADVAVELSQYFVSYFPHVPESALLYAVSLSRKSPASGALEAWDIVLRRNPLQQEWLAQALRQAWQMKDDAYAARWITLLNHIFLTPPPVSLLVELEARGWNKVGSVGIHNGTLYGWTWQALDTDDGKPRFSVEGASASPLQAVFTRRLKTTDRVLNVFSLDLPPVSGTYTVRVQDAHGQQVHGSPVAVSLVAPQKRGRGVSNSVAVIIPVYGDRRATLACIGSVLASRKHNRTAFELVVVWDHGPDARLLADMQCLAKRGKITLRILPYNRGFLGAVNFALEQHPKQAALLLNADTLVVDDWLDRLHAVARQRGVGTVTPFGTHAELLSFPAPQEKESVSTLTQVRRLDTACKCTQQTDSVKTIPVGVGFCMYITRTALDRLGGLDGHMLARGYGEEVDFCLRVREIGLRNVAACNVFVGHVGERSFGVGKRALAAQNNKAIFDRYPDYKKEYDAFLIADPLDEVRQQVTRRALEPHGGPLHLTNVLYAELPVWCDLEKGDAPFAGLLLQPCGDQIRAILRVRQNLPLSALHFFLPRDFEKLSQCLNTLAPSAFVFHGESAFLRDFTDRFPFPSMRFECPCPLNIPELNMDTCSGTWVTPPPRTVRQWERLCHIARKAMPKGHVFKVFQLEALWGKAPRPANIWPAPQTDRLDASADGLLFLETSELTSAWLRWAEANALSVHVLRSGPQAKGGLCA